MNEAGEGSREGVRAFIEGLPRVLPREKIVQGLRVLTAGLFIDEPLLEEVVNQYRLFAEQRSGSSTELSGHKAFRRLFDTDHPKLHYLLEGKVCLVGHLVPCSLGHLSSYKIPQFLGSLHDPEQYLNPKDPMIQKVVGLRASLDPTGFALEIDTRAGALKVSESALRDFVRIYQSSKLLQNDFGAPRSNLREMLAPLVGVVSRARVVGSRKSGLVPLIAWRSPQRNTSGKPQNHERGGYERGRQGQGRQGQGRQGRSSNERGGSRQQPHHPGKGVQTITPQVLPPLAATITFRRYRMLTLLVEESNRADLPGRVIGCVELQGRNLEEWLLSEVRTLKVQSAGRPLGTFRFADTPGRYSLGSVQAHGDSLQISLRVLRSIALKGPHALTGEHDRGIYTIRHCLEALGKSLAQSERIELRQIEHNIPRDAKHQYDGMKDVHFRSAPGWVFVVRGRNHVEGCIAKLRRIKSTGKRQDAKSPATPSSERGSSERGSPPRSDSQPNQDRRHRNQHHRNHERGRSGRGRSNQPRPEGQK